MRPCIPAHIVEKMKAALVSGDLSIQKLYDMKTSEERKAEFGKYVHDDVAEFVNLKFETAMASERRDALVGFIKEITTVKEQKTAKTKGLLDRVKELKDEDFLDPDSIKSTLTDVISDRLGIRVSPEQMKTISEKADAIDRLKKAAESAQHKDLPTKEYFKQLTAANVDYYGAMTDLDKFINSQTPTHNLKVMTGTIGRANMLLNLPPAVVNTISNAVQGIMQAFERRIAGGQYKGANADFAVGYAKMAMEVFHKTGFDISRNYAEDFRLGEHVIHSEGPGIIRKVGRGMSKVVFKYMLGYSDVTSASIASADSMAVQTAKIARKMGLKGDAAKARALEIFKDAILDAPQTNDGKIVRAQAIADAEKATWTNKGFLADVSMGLRDWLNNSTGDLQLGYWNIPFVKTGANVIQFGIESTPVGTIAALAKLKPALAAMNDKISPDMKPMQEVIRLAVRSGMGMILSMILASLIPPDDFFSAYDVMNQKQRDELGLKKGVYNAVKIGGKWISLDFFGALGSGFVGMMYARKYGDGAVDTAFKYGQGVGTQALQIPGIRDFEDLYTSIKDTLTADSIEDAAKKTAGATLDSVRTRVIPGIVNTIAQATDDKVRQTDKDNILDKTKAGIPGLRQTLPAKIDQTTGQEIKDEGWMTNLLFGSRVKTANESAVIDEIGRLDKSGFAPTISPIERSSERVKGLKVQLGDNFNEALKYYGTEYGKQATKLIESAEYKTSSDEEKQGMLNKVRSQVRDGYTDGKGIKRVGMLDKFHYVKVDNVKDAVSVIAESFPKREKGEDAENFKIRVENHKTGLSEGVEFLKAQGITEKEALESLRKTYKSRGYHTNIYDDSGNLTAYGKRVQAIKKQIK